MDTRTQVNKTYSLTIREYYLDYVNNFLSLEYFASHHCLTLDHARQLVKMGREMHETHCENLKEFN